MASRAVSEVNDECMASPDEVAELFAEDGVRVRRLVRTCVRAPEPLIEDACQLAWIRLLLSRDRVRRETATAWLVKTAVHEVFKLIRQDRRELSLDALSEDPGRWPAASAPDLLDELVEQRARLDSIRILPERQQRLVWLRGLGLTYTEMAGQTGTTRRTVERQLLRAKRTLVSQQP
jgi:RNA polymerase sigma factor (sigma-70 family)